MDSYNLIITPDAEDNLFEIRDYIANELLAPDTALRYVQEERLYLLHEKWMAPGHPFLWSRCTESFFVNLSVFNGYKA